MPPSGNLRNRFNVPVPYEQLMKHRRLCPKAPKSTTTQGWGARRR